MRPIQAIPRIIPGNVAASTFLAVLLAGVSSTPWVRVLTFLTVVGNSGQVICWIQVSDDGRYLYTTNQLDSTVSVYDLGDPVNPVEVDFDDLLFAPDAAQGGLAEQESLTPDGRCLYVIEQRLTDAPQDGSANALHGLVATQGSLSEPFLPTNLALFGMPRTARPQGIVAF